MSSIKIFYKEQKLNEIYSKTLQRINELGLMNSKYKNDSEFLVLICNIVEFLVNKEDELNKKEIVIEIYFKLFNICEAEKINLHRNIDFVHGYGSIKKYSHYKIFKTVINEWFLFHK